MATAVNLGIVSRFQAIIDDFNGTVASQFSTHVQKYVTTTTRNPYIVTAGLAALALAGAALKFLSKHGPIAAAGLAGAGMTALLLSNRSTQVLTVEYEERLRDVHICFAGISSGLRAVAHEKRRLLREELSKGFDPKKRMNEQQLNEKLENLDQQLDIGLKNFDVEKPDKGTDKATTHIYKIICSNQALRPLAKAYLAKISSKITSLDQLVQRELDEVRDAAFELLYGYERPADGKSISDRKYLRITSSNGVPIVATWISIS